MAIYIYKVESTTDDKEHIYVGSSTNPIRRWTQHKSYFKTNTSNRSVVHKVFTAYGIEDTKMTILEECTPETRDEREAYYINTIPCVNRIHLGRTQKQYKEEHKEQIKAVAKIHYEANKESILTKNKEYNKSDAYKAWKSTVTKCECGHDYTNGHKARHYKKYHI